MVTGKVEVHCRDQMFDHGSNRLVVVYKSAHTLVVKLYTKVGC